MCLNAWTCGRVPAFTNPSLVKVAAFLLKQISSNATLVQKTSWCQDALFLAQLVCKGSGSQPEIPAGSQKSEVFKLLTFF